MKKNRFGFLLLLTALAIALGFYLYAASRAEDGGDDASQDDTAILYLQKEADDVAEIVFRTAGSSFAIERSGSIYTLSSDPDFPLDQTVASSMADAVAVITFERSFRPTGSDLSAYGLADPSATLSVTYDDGAKLTLEIGDYNQYSAAYYCQLGDGLIYLMKENLLGKFDYTMTELLQDEAVTRPSDGTSALTAVTLTDRDGTIVTYEKIEGDSETEDLWRKVSSDGTILNSDASDEVLALYRELFMISLSDWAAYNVTGEEALRAYGLDVPALSIVFSYNESITHTPEDGSPITTVHERAMGFLIGDRVSKESDPSEDGEEPSTATRYFLLEGGKVVYRIGEDELTQVLSDVPQ